MNVSELADAYRRACYCIDCGGETLLRRIGVTDARADRVLADAGCRRHWHVVTPCNPGSQPLADTDNAARLDALCADLRRAGWRSIPACNRGDAGDWEEPGFCILDAPQDRILDLARGCGQLAVVAGRLGAAPRLVWVRDPGR